MTEDAIRTAARERAAAMPAHASRPQQRRCSETPGQLLAGRAVVRRPVEVRDASTGDGLSFTGYASVTETGYEMWDMFGPYTEIVSAGAFDDTLREPGLDVPLVLGHDSMRRIARTTNGSLTLTADDTGLRCDAPNLDPADQDVAYIAPKLRSGLIDEMSFRFAITSGQWSPDYTEFRIQAADINRGDVSIVGYGANPHTSLQLRAAAVKLQENRALDPQDVNIITQALGWFSAVDNIVDEAQETLAAYLHVPNPDADDIAELAAASLPTLRAAYRGIRKELRRRGQPLPMAFDELLSA